MPNFLKKYKLLFLKEFRELYPTRSAIFTQILGEMGTILLYWFTAKAISPKLEFTEKMGNDYFSYVMLGELTLLIPATLLYHYTKTIKTLFRDDVLDYLNTQPYNKTLFLLESVFPVTLLKGVQMTVTLILLYLFFNFKFPLTQIPILIIAIITSLPAFIGLGLIASAIILRWGRGERVIIMISNSAYILAGVYFPTDVFPKSFTLIIDWVSPFNNLLKSIRKLNTPDYNFILLIQDLSQMFFSGIILFIVGYLIMELSFKRVIHRKKSLLI